ncbi:MAG: energy transducer TonB, partial [Betaproteobacteria bacterium]
MTASLGLHALLIATLALILAPPGGARPIRPAQAPIVALLVGGGGAPEAASVVATVPAVSPPRAARRASPPLAAPKPGPALPWADLPVDVELPSALFDRPMVAEGVELMETRNIATLDETIERRIRSGYPIEPAYPVELKPAETIGYPIAAIEEGLEGRVLVWFGVDEEGRVVERAALDGPYALREWVLERLDRLVDKPARNKETKPMRGWVALEVEFTRAAAEQARARAAAL